MAALMTRSARARASGNLPISARASAEAACQRWAWGSPVPRPGRRVQFEGFVESAFPHQDFRPGSHFLGGGGGSVGTASRGENHRRDCRRHRDRVFQGDHPLLCRGDPSEVTKLNPPGSWQGCGTGGEKTPAPERAPGFKGLPGDRRLFGLGFGDEELDGLVHVLHQSSGRRRPGRSPGTGLPSLEGDPGVCRSRPGARSG